MEGIVSDASGFFSQVCPSCQRRFKVSWVRGDAPGEGGLPALAHCPYCEHTGDDFRTLEQKKYQEASVARIVIKELKSGTRMPNLPSVPVEANDDLPALAAFACCEGSIRHDERSLSLFCPFCGKPDASS